MQLPQNCERNQLDTRGTKLQMQAETLTATVPELVTTFGTKRAPKTTGMGR
jgi:hypothetical protein